MEPNQNLRKPSALNSPTVKRSSRLINPEAQSSAPGKRELSPSNHSQNTDIINKLQHLIKEQTSSLARLESGYKSQIQELLSKINKLEQNQRVLKESVEEIRQENSEMMEMNETLKQAVFCNEVKEYDIKKMQEEQLQFQKRINGLEAELKQKTNFINIQMIAKEHNANIIEEMKFEIQQVHELYNEERAKTQALALKLKKAQEEQGNLKKKIRELEKKSLQKSQKQSNQSLRIFQRESQNLKEKIRVLTSINDRQKQQIADLMVALDSKPTMPLSTLTQTRQQESNCCPFDQEYSQIMQKCLTQSDGEQLRCKMAQLQHTVSQLRQENMQLKKKLQLGKMGNALEQLEGLVLQKEELEIHIQEQSKKIVELNQQLYQYNHQNYTLKQQRQQYYEMCKQLEQTNIKLADQLKDAYEDKIKYMKQVNTLMQSVKELEQFKVDYQTMEEEYQLLKEEMDEGNSQVRQLQRKNKQLLSFIQELRASEQKLNNQLIEKDYQIEQLRSSKSQISQYKPPAQQNKVGRLLHERNMLLIGGLNKFKQMVLDEMRVMSLQLSISMTTCKSEEAQELATKLRRRMDTVLQAI